MAKKKNSSQQKKRLAVRLIAILLAVLLAGSALVSVVLSAHVHAEEAVRDQYELNIEYMEDEQALRVTQRLVYHNRTGRALDRVIFTAAANVFRRESALNYENDELEAVGEYGLQIGRAHV